MIIDVLNYYSHINRYTNVFIDFVVIDVDIFSIGICNPANTTAMTVATCSKWSPKCMNDWISFLISPTDSSYGVHRFIIEIDDIFNREVTVIQCRRGWMCRSAWWSWSEPLYTLMISSTTSSSPSFFLGGVNNNSFDNINSFSSSNYFNNNNQDDP